LLTVTGNMAVNSAQRLRAGSESLRRFRRQRSSPTPGGGVIIRPTRRAESATAGSWMIRRPLTVTATIQPGIPQSA
jgi:hypothetical protein